MNGREGERQIKGLPSSGGKPPGDGDILEQGRERTATVRWRLPRAAVIAGAAALVAGLAVGYAAGTLHARKGSPAFSASGGPPAQAITDVPVAGYPLSQSSLQCSAQTGTDLQLGMQITNVSAAPAVLSRVHVLLPLGGLKEISQAWGTCGQLPAPALAPANTLQPGASAWFTVTFRVLIKCPQPLPVQFTLDYEQNGSPASEELPGFDDLGQVVYTGCP
jgi:hypothetical protein